MGSVLAPLKVIMPGLVARIKEREILSCDWILGKRAMAFELVATMAGKPEILANGFAALRCRDDMLDFKWTSHQLRRRAAITAAMTRILCNLMA